MPVIVPFGATKEQAAASLLPAYSVGRRASEGRSGLVKVNPLEVEMEADTGLESVGEAESA